MEHRLSNVDRIAMVADCAACGIFVPVGYRKQGKGKRHLACKTGLTDSNRESRLKMKYGIDLEAYNWLWESQGGCCAICGVHDDALDYSLHVDHDHETNTVRGLLCGPCNQGMGQFRDSVEIMLRAVAYLDQGGVLALIPRQVQPNRDLVVVRV